MSQPEESTQLNLAGVWHGLYSYRVGKEPVPFVAILSDAEGWLNGTTEETGTAGDALGQILTASLQGRRTRRSVTMLKIYHGGYMAYDSVHYLGDLNEDATEIAGTWRIPGDWSGTFLMIRQRPVAAMQSREAAEQT